MRAHPFGAGLRRFPAGLLFDEDRDRGQVAVIGLGYEVAFKPLELAQPVEPHLVDPPHDLFHLAGRDSVMTDRHVHITSSPRAARVLSDAVGDWAAHRPAGRIELDLVDVAPAPDLARLERSHDRVSGAAEMFCGMACLRVGAAADVPPNNAQPHEDPLVTGAQAVLATGRALRAFANLIEVA